jgi:hypothetical protein
VTLEKEDGPAMYVRVLHFTCREDTQKHQIQDVYRRIVSEVQDADGFIGSTLMMREHACLGMAMMYWRDDAAAAKAGPHIVSLLGEHAHGLLEHAPQIEGYFVIENGILPKPGVQS